MTPTEIRAARDKLNTRASGYAMAGERASARLAITAARQLHKAAEAMEALEKKKGNGNA